jgi:hypothetical protein
MENGSSLEVSSNVVTSSQTVRLAIDAETAGKLSDAAESTEGACAIILASDESLRLAASERGANCTPGRNGPTTV